VRAVLIDTNMFAVPFVHGIDLVYQIMLLVPDAELLTTSRVLDEVSLLAHHPLIKKGIIDKHVKVVAAMGKADDSLLKEAVKRHGIVATNDKELRNRCLKEGVPVIFMRGKSHLELRNP